MESYEPIYRKVDGGTMINHLTNFRDHFETM